MQGLGAARPPVASPQPGGGGAQDPKQLMQTAGAILQDLAQKFGPQILQVLKQLLDASTPQAGAGGGAPLAAPQAGPQGPPPGR